jgi:hypothetical protein
MSVARVIRAPVTILNMDIESFPQDDKMTTLPKAGRGSSTSAVPPHFLEWVSR